MITCLVIWTCRATASTLTTRYVGFKYTDWLKYFEQPNQIA